MLAEPIALQKGGVIAQVTLVSVFGVVLEGAHAVLGLGPELADLLLVQKMSQIVFTGETDRLSLLIFIEDEGALMIDFVLVESDQVVHVRVQLEAVNLVLGVAEEQNQSVAFEVVFGLQRVLEDIFLALPSLREDDEGVARNAFQTVLGEVLFPAEAFVIEMLEIRKTKGRPKRLFFLVDALDTDVLIVVLPTVLALRDINSLR